MNFMKSIMAMVVMALSLTSCLESNLEELPTYEGNDITSVKAYYRYIDSSTSIPASGENAVKQKQLHVDASNIDADNATCNVAFGVPTNFSETEKAGASLNKLVVVLNVSSAAVVTPIEGSPKLGTPADWTTPHKYSIKAANGKIKIWTITCSLNK